MIGNNTNIQMKKYIVALLLGLTTFLHAQNSITGKVTDSKNNPLPGVTVYASELHKSTKTDQNGMYTLTELPNGNLTLVFSSRRICDPKQED